jgi:hypothetical protein
MRKFTVLVLSLLLLLGFYNPNLSASAAGDCDQYKGVKKIWWDGIELKKGQIGRLTIMNDTPLFKLNGDNRTFSRTLKKGEFYRIYAFKPGMLSVGGGYYVVRDSKVTYQTPSRTKLMGVRCINGQENPVPTQYGNNGQENPVPTEYGNIKGTITWQYNRFIGTKPDVGANIFLIPVNFISSKYSMSQLELFSMIGSIPEGSNLHYVKANGYGNYELTNVPIGKYIIVISSKNTTRDFQQPIDSYTEETLVPILGSGYDKFKEFNLYLQKYNWSVIEIKKNSTLDVSKDFGFTFI